MIAEELKVIVDAETGKAVKNLKKYDQISGKTEKGMRKMTGQLAKSAAGWLSIGAAIGVAIKIGKESVQLARQQEQAEAKLAAVLNATGEAAGFNQAQLQRMASGLQSITTFGDEAIIEMQSLLLTFKNIQGPAFERTQGLALDLSAAFGQDLKSSALQLGKALEDPATGLTALNRIGVSFTTEQENVIKALQETGDMAGAQTIILDTLEGQVGGVAEAMADTASGGAQQFENTMGDLQEVFGGFIDNALAPARTAIMEVANSFLALKAAADDIISLSGQVGDAFASNDYDKLNDTLDETEAQIKSAELALEEINEQIENTGFFTGQNKLNRLYSDQAATQERIAALMALQQVTQDKIADLGQEAADESERRRRAEEAALAAQVAANAEAERISQLVSDRDEAQAKYNDSLRETGILLQQGIIDEEQAEKRGENAARAFASALIGFGYDGVGEHIGDQLLRDMAAKIKGSDDIPLTFAGEVNDALAAAAEQATANMAEYNRELQEAEAATLRIQQSIQDVAIGALADIGSALAAGGEIDYTGIARSAIVGITDAVAPGFGQVAGAAVDIFESSWTKLFGASEEELSKTREKANERLFEISDSYRTEAEIRRDYVNELQDIFGIEQQVLRDQFERGILDVSEFREQGTALNESQRTELSAAESAAAAQGEADLEAARQEKVDKIQAAITPLQKELDQIYANGWQWFTKRDNVLEEEIAALQARKVKAQTAVSLQGIAAAAQGANFMTNGPQLLMVGENGPEHVRVDPAPGAGSNMGGETINIIVHNAYGIDDLEAKLQQARERMRRRGNRSMVGMA